MAISIEDILNQALARIGYSTPIGYILEGSKASRRAVEFYSQERDDLLSINDWQFARRQVNLTVIKTAPVGGYNISTPWSSQYPLLPWQYEYAFPDNCLQVRSIRSSIATVPDFDPSPKIFTVANDNTLNVPAKVVLANVSNAVASITAQVTDPEQWTDSQFVEALINRCALRFQENMNPQPEEVKIRATEDQISQAMGKDNRG